MSVRSQRRICVIGAGGLGSCLSLELASRGHEVTLFEKNPAAIAESSFYNEGKVHLGYIYAKDQSLATAAQMVDGALAFMAGLKRWISNDADSVTSTPFYYGVHTGSLMPPAALLAHYRDCEALYQERRARTTHDYLDLGVGSHVRHLHERDFPDGINGDLVSDVFETTEHAVDPRVIAAALNEALRSEPRVALRLNARVLDVESVKAGFIVKISRQGSVEKKMFTDVVNATWFARLPLDRKLGIVPPGPWSHRYKFGNRIFVEADRRVASLTMVQGPFGDVVNFGRRGFFVSWYPTGRTAMSMQESPPDWNEHYSREQRMEVFRRSYAEIVKRHGALTGVSFSDDSVDPGGCVIYALGTEDVDHQQSRLHERVDVGIQSQGRYHSVDTGKYTLVPYWAIRTADRVLAT